ncbi:hypothetical protein BJ508DRAFT_415164 [Ascobolus immersus RN42]|uniref:Uncharacterized protein n=1 Tax=Ascobolus immersus RN42 TaxID=1160509 RepID=A0A3N4IGY4_ASCIM|nr:hypothetical protein BJ508DRAFT_415164 [Ascobolus immersus RN42]
MPPLPPDDPPSSASSLLTTTQSHLNHLFKRGGASRPSPASSIIALSVFAIIFAFLGLAIVWWFIRRGGFVWKRNDWRDYVLTVTRKGGLADDDHITVFSDGSIRKRGSRGTTGTRTVVLDEWDRLDDYEKSVVSGEYRSGVGGWKGLWTRLRGGEWEEGSEWDNLTSVSRRVPNRRRKKRKSQPSSEGTQLKQVYYDLEDQTDAHSFTTQEPARVPGWTPEAEAELERERKAARQAELDRSKSFYAGDDRKLQRDEYKRHTRYEDYRRDSDLGMAYPQSEPRNSGDELHELPTLKPPTKSVREKAEKKGPTIRPVQPSTRVKREPTQKPMGARAAPFESKKRQSTRREAPERVPIGGPREPGQPRRESTTRETTRETREERRERRESRQPHRSSTIATPTAPTSSRTSYPERSRTQHASQQSHAPAPPVSRHQPSTSQSYGRDGGQQMYGSSGLPSEQNDPRRSYGGGAAGGGKRRDSTSSDSSDSSYDSSSSEEAGTKAYPHRIDPPRVDLFREAGVGGESQRGGGRR